jgi:hypothetical protein
MRHPPIHHWGPLYITRTSPRQDRQGGLLRVAEGYSASGAGDPLAFTVWPIRQALADAVITERATTATVKSIDPGVIVCQAARRFSSNAGAACRFNRYDERCNEKTVESELRVLRNRQETIERLKRDRDALMRYYAGMAPETLDNLAPEDRHQVYRMLRLHVVVSLDGGIEVGGALGDCLSVCDSEPTS